MNVLFVHEVDWLAKVVTDFQLLGEGLSLRGHKVYVIDYEDTWKRKSLFDFGTLKTREFNGVSRAFPGASVDVRRPGFIKLPGLSRMSAWVTHSRELEKTIRDKKIDAVILYSVPTNGLQTLSKARKLHVPVFFRSIDMLNRLVPYGFLRPVTRMMEKRVYSRVDGVLANAPQYMKYVIGMGVPANRVKLLPFPMDTALFRPGVDTSEVRKKWGLKSGEPLIVFVGTLFDFSGLDEFTRHFPEVLKAVPEARLLIVGDGVQRPKLEKIISELGLQDHVTITGFQPYRTMPEYINAATVCINTFWVREATTDTFPSKVMQYVACGKATVATAMRGITALLPGESHGVVYAGGPAEMVPEVIALLKDPERRRRLGEAGLNAVRGKYSFDKVAAELETILKAAVKENRGANSPA